MTSYLFRVNSNDNGIYLTCIFDRNGNPIGFKKSTSSFDAIERLRREVRGADWYSKLTHIKLVSVTRELPSYYSVIFKYIEGRKVNFRDGYMINYKYIEKAISQYCEVWSKLSSKDLCIHGDFSIDNLIFGKKNTIIIDWEHFSQKSLPIGFDALNLIFEQLYFLKKNTNLHHDAFNHARLMLKKLDEYNCLGEEYLNDPLSKMRNLIIRNKDIWGKQLKKLPIMKIDSDFALAIDNALCVSEI